ncbi:MAG: tetratricopeptide repeat protein [Candidatus Omnitrophota bacterium]|jgi:tetratricopeptide (TPR) repeat protein
MKIILSFIVFLTFINSSYALDWKLLHEEADKKNIEEAVKIQKAYPDSMENLYVLGLFYLNKHMDKKAEIVFNEMLAKEAGLIEARWGLAEVLRRAHKLDESENVLKEIISSQPFFSPACISLAYIKYTKMKFNDSVTLAYKVIKQGKKNVDLTNYVRAYLILAGAKGMIANYGGLFSKVINGTGIFSTLKKAQRLSPGYAGVLFGMGSFYLLAPAFAGRDINKAEDYLKKAIVADPLFADAYVRISQVYQLKGDSKKAQIYLKKALQIDPGNELAVDIKNGSCKFICVKKTENRQ